MLKLRFKNNKHTGVWLVEPKVTIGRSPGNDLVLEDHSVAEYHAEILVSHEQLSLVNCSGQPLHVNDQPVESRRPLAVNDQLRVGRIALEVVDPKQEQRKPAAVSESTGWGLKANHAALANRVFPIQAETVIGRSPDCDISLAAAHLSRRHVKLFVENGLLYARDLGSANGTYLNGERITEARVRRGDELRFDTLSFAVLGPPSEDLEKTTIRAAVSFGSKPTVPVKAPGRVAAPPPATRVAARVPPRTAEASLPETELAQGGGRSKLAAGLVLLVFVVVAAGVAWQQGMFGQ